jgi:hypothetical protein
MGNGFVYHFLFYAAHFLAAFFLIFMTTERVPSYRDRCGSVATSVDDN